MVKHQHIFHETLPDQKNNKINLISLVAIYLIIPVLYLEQFFHETRKEAWKK